MQNHDHGPAGLLKGLDESSLQSSLQTALMKDMSSER